MASKFHISCYQGDAVQIPDTITGSGSIAGWTFTATLKKTKQSASATLTLTTAGGGVVILDATARSVGINLTAAQTAALTPGTYVVDVRRTNSGSEAELSDGYLTINKPVGVVS